MSHCIIAVWSTGSPLAKHVLLPQGEAGKRKESGRRKPLDGFGVSNKNAMVDTASIDRFLAGALCAVRSGKSAAWPEAGDEWRSSEDLSAIWSRIEFHGIAVLLNEHSTLLEGWPVKMADRIAEEARLAGLWEATHGAAVAQLVEALCEAGIETVLMKGTALAYSVHEDPSARRRGDSDLLVRPADLDETRKMFEANGWHRADETHGVNCQEGWLHVSAAHFEHAIDLHWEPSDRAVLQQVLRPDDFFANKHPLPRLSKSAWAADPALTIIHETINQKWHEAHGYWTEHGQIRGTRRLIWSIDFDLLVRSLEEGDWARLHALSQERGVGPLVAEALRGAIEDLELQFPEAYLVRLEKQELRTEIAEFFATTDNLTEFWLNLRSAHNWRERARMVRDRGFPPREYLLSKYPGKDGWPTALLQGRLLIETAGRVLRRVGSR